MKLNPLAGAVCVSLIFSAPFVKALTTTKIVQLAKQAVVQNLKGSSGDPWVSTPPESYVERYDFNDSIPDPVGTGC